MKILKYLIITVLALGLIYLLLNFLGPKKFDVKRSIEINSSKEEVFEKISNFENWKHWGVWYKTDSTIVNKYEGNPSEIGHKSSWTSNGGKEKGEMTITTISLNQSLEYDLVFNEFMKSKGSFTLKQTGDKTNVEWRAFGDIPFMMRAMMLFGSMETFLGKDIEDGLANMKELLESSEINNESSTKLENLGKKTYTKKTFATIRVKAKMSEFFKSETYSKYFGELMALGIQPIGSPSTITHEWNETDSTADVSFAFPVTEGTKENGKMKILTIEETSSIGLDYYGAYDKISAAHIAINNYLKDNATAKHGVVIEEYVTDPATVKNSIEILTKIYYLLEK